MIKYEYDPTNPYKNTGAPRDVLPHVKSFCTDIAPWIEPVFVTIKPDVDAKVNECFPNVDMYISKHGGRSVLGWQIWERYGVFIEAELHAVWKNPEGNIFDVTPKTLDMSRILFLEDATLEYEGKQVNNIRSALLDIQVVTDLLNLYDAKFVIENVGDRAFQHGAIRLSEEEADLYGKIMQQIHTAEQSIAFMQSAKSHPCRCGSGRIYKFCHGK